MNSVIDMYFIACRTAISLSYNDNVTIINRETACLRYFDHFQRVPYNLSGHCFRLHYNRFCIRFYISIDFPFFTEILFTCERKLGMDLI